MTKLTTSRVAGRREGESLTGPQPSRSERRSAGGLRILTVGNMYPPHHLGGYELTWESAVDHLRGLGHSVRVLTTDVSFGGSPPGDDRGHVFRQLRWYWHDHRFPRMSVPGRVLLERSNMAILEAHVREFNPDVVSWWAMGGMSLSLIERMRRAEIPAVGIVEDDWMLYGPRVDAWTRAFLKRRRWGAAAERITGVPTPPYRVGDAALWIFASHTLRRRAADAPWPLPRAEVVHLGVEDGLFKPAPSRPWAWRLLYVGRIDPRKGIHTAIKALAVLPEEATLRVVGRGDDGHLAELRALADSAGLSDRVTFSEQARNDLPRTLAAADVVVFPVLWEEPWGLVPLEAMAVGTPVVATGAGGSGEYLHHEHNCLVFEPRDDPGALAQAVRRLADDPELRRTTTQGGFATAARFPAASFNATVANAIERVAREHRSP